MAQYFIDPCGVASPPRYTLAERAPIPQGATLGLLDNGKNNVSRILEQVSETLIERFGFIDVVHLRKPSVAHPCPEALLQQLLRRCTVVVNGVGDWGSCTSWSIHDGIELERRGVPTATLCTDEFAALGKRECSSLGLPDMPLIVLPHPTSALLGTEAEARAREAVDEIIYVLTQNRRMLAAEYAERIYAPPKRAFRARQIFVWYRCVEA